MLPRQCSKQRGNGRDCVCVSSWVVFIFISLGPMGTITVRSKNLTGIIIHSISAALYPLSERFSAKISPAFYCLTLIPEQKKIVWNKRCVWNVCRKFHTLRNTTHLKSCFLSKYIVLLFFPWILKKRKNSDYRIRLPSTIIRIDIPSNLVNPAIFMLTCIPFPQKMGLFVLYNASSISLIRELVVISCLGF